ncbi:hypothetical protein JCM10449v2_007761 [Rhodotorula kratochvilovae]
MSARRDSVDEPLLPTERDPKPPPPLRERLAPRRSLRTSTARLLLVGALLVVALYVAVLHRPGAATTRPSFRPPPDFSPAATTPAARLAQLNADYDPSVEGFGVGNVDLEAYLASLHATLDEILGPASASSNTSVPLFEPLDDPAHPPLSDAALRAALDCHLSLSCTTPAAPLPSTLYATARSVSPVPSALQSWLDADPSLSLRLLSDADVSAFVASRFPRLAQTFEDLPLAILRFDLFRLLVLLARGGTYTDADTRLLRPLSAWGSGAEDRSDALLSPAGAGADAPPQLVVGVEWARRTERNALNALYTRQAGLVQWTFSASAGHPVLVDAVRRVLRHGARVRGAEEREGEGPLQFDPQGGRMVLEWSGPAVLTDSVARYLRTRLGAPLSSLSAAPHPLRLGSALLLPLQALNARTSAPLKLLDWALGRGWAPWSEAWGAGSVVHEHAASWWGQKIAKG